MRVVFHRRSKRPGCTFLKCSESVVAGKKSSLKRIRFGLILFPTKACVRQLVMCSGGLLGFGKTSRPYAVGFFLHYVVVPPLLVPPVSTTDTMPARQQNLYNSGEFPEIESLDMVKYNLQPAKAGFNLGRRLPRALRVCMDASRQPRTIT